MQTGVSWQPVTRLTWLGESLTAPHKPPPHFRRRSLTPRVSRKPQTVSPQMCRIAVLDADDTNVTRMQQRQQRWIELRPCLAVPNRLAG